ncbi:MAG: hypothetical protein AAF690_15630 [Acidobacteriota bacterium]
MPRYLLTAMLGLLLAGPAANASNATEEAKGELYNLGLAFGSVAPPTTGHPCFLFPVREDHQGDLNGDGDTLDRPTHALCAKKGLLWNTGFDRTITLPGQHRRARYFFGVLEEELGFDQNGDGDLADWVLHRLNLKRQAIRATDIVFNLAWVDRYRVFFIDWGTSRLSVYDERAGTTRVLSIAPSAIAPLNGHALLLLRESKLNVDLNGDNDTADRIVHHYDNATGSLRNLGLAALELRSTAKSAAFLAREDHQSSDLNGDGDLADHVLHYFLPPQASSRGRNRPTTEAQVVNTGLAVPPVFASLQYELSERWLAVAVDEAAQTADANDDGDLLDKTLTVIDLKKGRTHHTEQALSRGRVAEIQIGGSLIGFVGELTQPPENDLYFYDAQRRSTEAAGAFLASNPFWIGDDVGYYLRRESLWGDLNGDGDDNDRIATVFDRRQREPLSLGVAAYGPSFAGRWLGFLVSESSESRDLTGDGDTSDFVPFVFDRGSESLSSLGIAAGGTGHFSLGEGLFLLPVAETTTDLNGDGDTKDLVLHAYTAKPRRRP